MRRTDCAAGVTPCDDVGSAAEAASFLPLLLAAVVIGLPALLLAWQRWRTRGDRTDEEPAA